MRKVDKEIKFIYECGIENMVVLVTTRFNGKNYALTSGTLAEVSHEPPMLSVSICPDRFTHDRIMDRGAFAVNLLSVDQKGLPRNADTRRGETGINLKDSISPIN